MPLSREAIERRAVTTGVKASIKRDHLVTEQELLALRVQTMPVLLRITLVLVGILSLVFCWIGWPSDSLAVRVIEALWGVFAILFGSFGVRRTLSHLLDSIDAGDLAGSILEMIADAVSNLDL